MRKTFLFISLFVCAVGAVSVARAQEKPQAYVGAQIITVSGATIPNGTLVVQRGKIIAVGNHDATKIPIDAETHDVTGKVIMPGIIDTHSHIGGGAGGDNSAPIQSDVRILDAINVRDKSLRRAQAGGITTVNIMPGSGHLSSGQTLYVKLRANPRTIDDLFILDAQGKPMGGLKMANGTNPIRATPPFPGTRAKSAALVREQFVKAQEYRDKIRRAGGDASKMPPRDLLLETLAEVLDGKRVVHFHTHRQDDILTVLRLAKEFNFRVVLHHVTEGWRVPDEIVRAKAPCSIIVLDSPGGKLEAANYSLQNGAILERAGALVAIHTDDYITDSRLLLRSTALAVRGGMSRETALKALTINGAQILDLQNRTGSLDVGKDADFIVLSGDPFSVYTKVLETYVEGVKVFDRSNPEDRLIATGGYGAGRDQNAHTEDDEREEQR
jgi:imidazolonepropionase-like amidohydrolase